MHASLHPFSPAFVADFESYAAEVEGLKSTTARGYLRHLARMRRGEWAPTRMEDLRRTRYSAQMLRRFGVATGCAPLARVWPDFRSAVTGLGFRLAGGGERPDLPDLKSLVVFLEREGSRLTATCAGCGARVSRDDGHADVGSGQALAFQISAHHLLSLADPRHWCEHRASIDQHRVEPIWLDGPTPLPGQSRKTSRAEGNRWMQHQWAHDAAPVVLARMQVVAERLGVELAAATPPAPAESRTAALQ